MAKKKKQKLTAEELKNKIYKTYYDLNPLGDARVYLWRDVLRAKKSIPMLKKLLKEVESDQYL